MTQSVNERLNNASAVVGALIKETKALKAGVLELQSIVAAQNTLIAKLMEQAAQPRRTGITMNTVIEALRDDSSDLSIEIGAIVESMLESIIPAMISDPTSSHSAYVQAQIARVELHNKIIAS